jgi:hypothetical protein
MGISVHTFFFEVNDHPQSGWLDFTAMGGKIQGREVPQSLGVESGAKHPVWKTQINIGLWIPV